MAAGLLVLALLSGLFVNNVRGDIRQHSIPAEDVRSPTKYVATHRTPVDVILVNSSGSEGFSYYWPFGIPVPHQESATATNFQTTFPSQPQIIVAADRTLQGVVAAYAKAAALARSRPGSRIWLVRTHMNLHEREIWNTVLISGRVDVETVMTCSLKLLTPLPGGEITDRAQLDDPVTGPRC